MSRTCGRKIKHPTFGLAMRAMIKVQLHHMKGEWAGREAEVYQCDECGFYHWGRTKKTAITKLSLIRRCLKACQTRREVDAIMANFQHTIEVYMKGNTKILRNKAKQINQLAALKKGTLK